MILLNDLQYVKEFGLGITLNLNSIILEENILAKDIIL